MKRVLAVSLLFGALLLVPSRVRAAANPGATAWLVRISLPGGHQIAFGQVGAANGAARAASAVPVAVDGHDEFAATAPQPNRDRVVGSGVVWSDSTGSMTMEGAYAEASATSQTSSARASLVTGTGSGFAMASKLLTWDQQVQLGAEVTAINNAVFDPLNAQLQALAPALAPAGITPPAFTKMSALGLIDVGSGQLANATADVSNSAGFASARASAVASHVKLFGGFIEAQSVASQAVSETSAGAPSQSAKVWLTGLTVAGVPVVASGDGLAVAPNQLVSRTLLQPALDLILGELNHAGFTLKVLDRSGPGSTQSATGLEVDITTPQGPLVVSVGHAEASPPPELPAPPQSTGATVGPASAESGMAEASVPALSVGAPGVGLLSLPAAPSVAAPTPVATVPAPRSTGYRRIRWPHSVVRALGATYLALIFAGIGGAIGLPVLAAPKTRRRPFQWKEK